MNPPTTHVRTATEKAHVRIWRARSKSEKRRARADTPSRRPAFTNLINLFAEWRHRCEMDRPRRRNIGQLTRESWGRRRARACVSARIGFAFSWAPNKRFVGSFCSGGRPLLRGPVAARRLVNIYFDKMNGLLVWGRRAERLSLCARVMGFPCDRGYL